MQANYACAIQIQYPDNHTAEMKKVILHQFVKLKGAAHVDASSFMYPCLLCDPSAETLQAVYTNTMEHFSSVHYFTSYNMHLVENVFGDFCAVNTSAYHKF